MKYVAASLLIAFGFAVPGAKAQTPHAARALVPVDLAAGFTTIYANAPPAQCGCFFMYGGSAQVAVKTPFRLSLIFDYGQTTASNINGGAHDLRLTTYLAGARYGYHWNSKVKVYGQALAGAGQSHTNFAIDHATTRSAFCAGGGLDYRITPRFSARVAQVEYLRTSVPNGVNNRQNQIRLTAGVVFHLTRARTDGQ